MTTPPSPEGCRVALEHLAASGFDAVEVFHKRGRSRSFRLRSDGVSVTDHQEEGHAIRAGDAGGSVFLTATGPPQPSFGPAPEETRGDGLRLPPPAPIPRWSPPPEIDHPLLGEGEAMSLIDATKTALVSEMRNAKVVDCFLVEGASESALANSRGVAASVRQRAGSLFVEARCDSRRSTFVAATRDLRTLDALRIARGLADRLAIATRAETIGEEHGQCLLAPPVSATLLSGLRALWLGSRAEALAAALADVRGRLAADCVTVIDDPRLEQWGVLALPWDGEGVPTRRVVLVDQGRFRQPILSWKQRRASGQRACGCCSRAGWRDYPSPAPTQLFLEPNPKVATAQLLGELSRGFYVVEADGVARLSHDRTSFAIPVSGYTIRQGRATGCFSEAWLSGTVASYLHGIQALARDLRFRVFGDSLYGAPSVLVRGLRLSGRRHD